MANPFDQFDAQSSANPFDQFDNAQPAPRGVMDQLLGLSGPRYQTWPERAIRGAVSAAALPGEVMQDAQRPPPSQISDSDVSPLGVGRVLDLAGLASPVNPMARSGDFAIPGATNSIKTVAPKAPGATSLADMSDTGYGVVRNMGVDFHPQFAPRLGEALQNGPLSQFPDTATGTFGVVKKLQSPPEGAVSSTFGQIENARQQLRAVSRNYNNPTDQAAANAAISGIDDVLAQVPESAVLAGPIAAARDILQKSRGDYAAAKRVNAITGELDNATTGIAERADLSSAVANSGRNYDNSLRQGIASFLKSPSRTQGFTPEELAQAADIAKGSAAGNTARIAGNLLGGGGGLGAAAWTIPGLATALGTGNPVAAVTSLAPVAGMAIKGAENALSRRAINNLAQTLAKRSPLYEQMLANAPKAAAPTAKKAALIRSLIESAQPQQQ